MMFLYSLCCVVLPDNFIIEIKIEKVVNIIIYFVDMTYYYNNNIYGKNNIYNI